MLKNIVRYDMLAKPKKQAWYLTILSWILAYPNAWSHRLKVNKVGMEGLKPPYILLCTHHAFIDFSVTTAAIFPHGANYVVAIDGFINREQLLRNVGCICKRKFTNDIVLVRQIEHSLKVNKTIAAIYPEARYSIAGTTAILPESLGKMCKVMKVPVVVLNMHGNHLSSPVWNLAKRKVRLAADMTQIVTAAEIGTISVPELNRRIAKAFEYDEYRYLLDTHQEIKYRNRAFGLHRVLYQCPHCLTEHEMDSAGTRLWCNHCGKAYDVDTRMQLHGEGGDGKFTHIPDWYEWERSNVRRELEEGRYRFEDDVIVDSLPNANGFIRLGNAKLVHDMSGFHLAGTFEEGMFTLEKDPRENYSIHIEYDYLGKGADCISLSTLEDTYYIYPVHRKNVVTKLHFAAEELYKIVSSRAKEG